MKKLLLIEIYMPIFEKHKLIKPYERSVLQLLYILSRNDEKDLINMFKDNAKTHSTMKQKRFIPLYTEHLHFLVSRARWLVTKIYKQHTFELAPFTKEFVNNEL